RIVSCGSERRCDPLACGPMPGLAQELIGLLCQLPQNLPLCRSGVAERPALAAAQRVFLRRAQAFACFEQRRDGLRVASRELVDGPERNRRLAEILDATGRLVLAGLLQTS